MKTASFAAVEHTKPSASKASRPRMTRQLAEKRAVGDPKAPKFDGAAFLRSLKK